MLVKSGYSRDDKEYNFTPFSIVNHKGLSIGSHCHAIDLYGNLRNVKVTSIKTWKRNSNIEIHWKYGLREYGYSLLTPEGFTHGVTLGLGELIEKENK